MKGIVVAIVLVMGFGFSISAQKRVVVKKEPKKLEHLIEFGSRTYSNDSIRSGNACQSIGLMINPKYKKEYKLLSYWVSVSTTEGGFKNLITEQVKFKGRMPRQINYALMHSREGDEIMFSSIRLVHVKTKKLVKLPDLDFILKP